jgi:5-methylcytosine-specific restriction endonuclease McrBC GTP-binding regulatory subunit McrB
MIELNKNVIFTGVPGTGKTYLAKEIAKKIVGHNNANSNVAFAQFHPSYDYTDSINENEMLLYKCIKKPDFA